MEKNGTASNKNETIFEWNRRVTSETLDTILSYRK